MQIQVEQFVDSIFDDRIWHLRDEEYQKQMVKLWIGLAYEEGRKNLKLEVHKVTKDITRRK